MKPIVYGHMLYGKPCDVEMPNGKKYCRIVRYSKADGLYVVIANKKYFEYEMEYANSVYENNNMSR